MEPLEPIEASARQLLHDAGRPDDALTVTPIHGGGNNRAFRVDAGGTRYFLKQYFRALTDPRDRFASETQFLRFAGRHAPGWTPALLGANAAAGIALMEYVDGTRLANERPGRAEVADALAFFCALNAQRHTSDAQQLPTASEACFSIGDHLRLVIKRMDRLQQIRAEDEPSRAASSFARDRLAPFLDAVTRRLSVLPERDAVVPSDQRVLSPSDFGFHNALRTPQHALRFVDFEYAGWDDPAKTISDFFLQPAVPVPHEHYDHVITEAAAALQQQQILPRRVKTLYPLFGVKWCCILLNEFVPRDAARRTYARPGERIEDRRRQQLDRAGQLLAHLESATFPP